ncbi:RING finger protein [Quillaja saponaria]|uniref:RING finger protein n=1 Tax=Quillaja saponaria TaxID=32244 RepID=A0AAD7LG97_QUISA|nr:RING finger protein [Quillaja saponaria]
MWQKQPTESSYKASVKALEADIQHANTLTAALPRDYGGEYIQMRLSYSPLAPFLLYLMEWMDFSCKDTFPSYLGLLHILIYKVYVDGMPSMSSKERKATLKEFYAVIYPSLKQLEDEFVASQYNDQRRQFVEVLSSKKLEKLPDTNHDKDDECGICMENNAKMVLPNCGHSLCISCFHDWNERSRSCPFCRGSLRRVTSRDLWIVIGNNDVIDTVTLAKENLRRFYLYVETLPLIMHDTHIIVCDYML